MKTQKQAIPAGAVANSSALPLRYP
ncbi:hypothetical protein A2U01_0077571, partial [Trifolium medium]|nr:hypothetical protein [Trifolium medium]